jgi:hypothetical protein
MQPKDVKAYGADYSGREFTPAEINRYPGVWLDFLFRYIGYPGNRKCISHYPGAYRAHVDSGRPVGLYHQIGYRDFTDGESAGRAHARTALNDAQSKAVGWDGESPIVACFDRRMPAFTRDGVFYPAISLQTVRAYMRGFTSVAGSVSGFYGFEDTMRPAIDEDWANFTMQCGARSAHIPGITAWQENNEQPLLFGTSTDRLELYRRIDEVFGDTVLSDQDVDRVAAAAAAKVWDRRFDVFVGDSPVKNADGVPIWNSDAGNMLASGWGNTFNPTGSYASFQSLTAQNVALMAAVTALAQNPALTEERLQQMMNDAVRDNTVITGEITGSLQITGKSATVPAPQDPSAPQE